MKNTGVSIPTVNRRAAATGFLETLFDVFRVRPSFAVGYAIVFLSIAVAILAPWLAPYDPIQTNGSMALRPPSAEHWFGTDAVGMDIFSRTLYAPRVDITIALFGTTISALIGSLLGAWVGYFSNTRSLNSKIGFVVMRIADVMQSFPVFVFAIALVASLGQSMSSVVAAIAFVNTPIYLRLMRSQVVVIRERLFVQAAIVAGISEWKIIIRHILPNAMGPIMAQFSVNIAWSILLTAGLSFIGAGVRPPTPELGSMIAGGFQNIVTGQWWPSVIPGSVLAVIVSGFTLVGASIETLTNKDKMKKLSLDIAMHKRGER